MTATEKRLAALTTIMEEWQNGKFATRDEMATAVASLKKLGKTARWIETLDKWIDQIGTDELDEVWLMHQNCIWAGYAAR